MASELGPRGALKGGGVANGKTANGALGARFVVAATVGNALEFYDFITYAFFAIQIGHAFLDLIEGRIHGNPSRKEFVPSLNPEQST